MSDIDVVMKSSPLFHPQLTGNKLPGQMFSLRSQDHQLQSEARASEKVNRMLNRPVGAVSRRGGAIGPTKSHPSLCSASHVISVSCVIEALVIPVKNPNRK